jgi:hypothetical protein
MVKRNKKDHLSSHDQIADRFHRRGGETDRLAALPKPEA